MTDTGIFAQNIAYSYNVGNQVLHDVSAEIVPGSFLAILGVNGSGKSTFLNCLDGLLKAERGTVLINGRDLQSISREERAQAIAYVSQHSHANQLTVYDALLLGRKPYIRTAPREEDYEAVDQVIQRLHLEDYALRNVMELSGGEYQKMIIARAFVQQTQVLLLDEPTNNLDMHNQAEVMQLVRDEVDTNNLAAAAVMHDLNLSLRYCDRFLFLQHGEVAAAGGPEIVTSELVKSIYDIEADIIEYAGRRVMIAK